MGEVSYLESPGGLQLWFFRVFFFSCIYCDVDFFQFFVFVLFWGHAFQTKMRLKIVYFLVQIQLWENVN